MPSRHVRPFVGGLCGLLFALAWFGVAVAADVEPEADVDLTLTGRGKSFSNSIGMKFTKIPKGKFQMGSPEEDKRASDTEKPRHEVEISRDFYVGVYEVTQKQYRTVMGTNPSWWSTKGEGKDSVKGLDTDDFPVERVSWEDTQAFLKKLNEWEKHSLRGWEYRLPTEAEWEYCCRGGDTDKNFHFGDTLSHKLANYDYQRNLGRTCKVGSYPPNAFGLHDMHGNADEWCHDRYSTKYYANSPKRDPIGPSDEDLFRVFRGGGSGSGDWHCRCACRSGGAPHLRARGLGFRVALVPTR